MERAEAGDPLAADAEPAYYRVARILQQDIEQGILAPDSPLPTEDELARRYGVSRTTIRRTLTELIRSGRVYRPQPRGRLHVVRTPVEQEFSRFVGFFTEDMRARGLTPGIRVLAAEWVPAREAPAALALEGGERAARIVRLHQAGGVPMALQTSYLPEGPFPDLLDGDLAQSLLERVEAGYGRRFVHAVQHLKSRLPTHLEEKLLRIPYALPVFILERTSFGDDGRPLEHFISVLPSDRYYFRIELVRTM